MKSGISVTEDYELSAYRQPTRLMLMTTRPDAIQHIRYDTRQLDVTVEDISDLLDPLLKGMWGEKMYRIVMTVKSKKTKNQIKYTIQ
jgi:hypothetical protein